MRRKTEDESSLLTPRRHTLGTVNSGFYPLILARKVNLFLALLMPVPLADTVFHQAN